jgi:L-ascorbate metabolism protein UlaG (beta-lactamase superfamily)
MKITWFGQACFKLQSKHASVLIDPYDAEIGLKPPTTQADLVLSTDDASDSHNIGAAKGESFIIRHPGEYEVKHALVRGLQIPQDAKNKESERKITVYSILMERIHVVHLGDLASPLSSMFIDELGEVDVLLVPIGGHGRTLDAKGAARVITEIEPRVVIPMQFKIPGLALDIDDHKAFSEEMGIGADSFVDSYKVKRSELPVEETDIVLLSPLKAR